MAGRRSRTPTATPGTLTANAVISAVGFLSRPKFPAIKGMETFDGPAFHTTWWDHAFDDPAGKHLAVIGTGCSGMQLVPELERRGATVTVFQRRPSWIFEVPIYRAELPEGLKWLDRNMPYYRNFEKFRAVWMVGDHVGAAPFMRDPAWDDPDSLSEMNQAARQASLDYLERKLGDRPDLLAACTPHSPAMASRPVIDNGWLDAIRGPNVELVTDAIGRIVPEGIVTESGRVIEADAIVFATGFETSKFLWPMEVTGRRGTLHELWAKDGARAYLGITMPGFPNLFCIYGPNTNSNQGTIPTMGSELQTRYALQCIEELFRTGSTSIDLTPRGLRRLQPPARRRAAQDDLLRPPPRHLLHQRARPIVVADVLVDAGVLADDPAPRLRRLRAVLSAADPPQGDEWPFSRTIRSDGQILTVSPKSSGIRPRQRPTTMTVTSAGSVRWAKWPWPSSTRISASGIAAAARSSPRRRPARSPTRPAAASAR